MSLITRLNQLFSKPDSNAVIGVSMQQKAVAYCMVSEDKQVKFEQEQVFEEQYPLAIEQLAANEHFQGQCHVVLSSKHNQIVQIDKPNVPKEEVNAAVKWQVKDLVTISPEDMIVDYYDTPELAGGMEKINVVCADRNQLVQYVEGLSSSQALLKSITVEEFAFAALCPESDDAKLLVCQQPNEEVLLIIVKQKQLYFQRRLRGMQSIATKSTDELNMGTIDSLSLEIQRSTDYFERQLKQAPIRSIEVLVPMENEAYLARRLAENTNVSVNLFEMPEGFADCRAYAACVGATMLRHQEMAQ